MDLVWAIGLPSLICSSVIGLLIWWFKRYVDKKDRDAEEREKNTEKLMLMIMQTGRANNVLAVATAKAVQRIPDAKCNGDMTAALAQADAIQKEEQKFLFDQGIKHIFGDSQKG